MSHYLVLDFLMLHRLMWYAFFKQPNFSVKTLVAKGNPQF